MPTRASKSCFEQLALSVPVKLGARDFPMCINSEGEKREIVSWCREKISHDKIDARLVMAVGPSSGIWSHCASVRSPARLSLGVPGARRVA